MYSMKIMLSITLLVAVAIVTVSADTGKFSTCCTKVGLISSKIHLQDFFMQKADPPCVEAVMFITKERRILCAKPNLPLVIQKVKEIRLKKEALQNNNATSKADNGGNTAHVHGNFA